MTSNKLYFTIKTITIFAFFIAWTWGTMALFYDGPNSQPLKYILILIFISLAPVIFHISQSFKQGAIIGINVFCCLLIWWFNITPVSDKDWAVDVAKISHGKIADNKLTMFNVRNFDYTSETEFTEEWQTREYDLNNLQGLDLFMSYWASDHIAHTIMSWDFGQDQHLAISIETRKDKTQEYSALKGFFKQYELAYIAADEKDLIKLRTNYRKERVYLYQLKVDKNKAMALLEDYLTAMNSLATKPMFYNALTHNCTTTIRLHANAINPGSPTPMDWRLLLSGHTDEYLYEIGRITTDQPFAKLRVNSRVDERVSTKNTDNYSNQLRKLIK